MTQLHPSSPFGTHVILDAWGVDPGLLNDPTALEAAIHVAIAAGGATLIDMCIHEFNPQGVTATATLKESHIAIHTWPEHGYIAADLFFCAAGRPEAAAQALIDQIKPRSWELHPIQRGAGFRHKSGEPALRTGAS